MGIYLRINGQSLLWNNTATLLWKDSLRNDFVFCFSFPLSPKNRGNQISNIVNKWVQFFGEIVS